MSIGGAISGLIQSVVDVLTGIVNVRDQVRWRR